MLNHKKPKTIKQIAKDHAERIVLPRHLEAWQESEIKEKLARSFLAGRSKGIQEWKGYHL